MPLTEFWNDEPDLLWTYRSCFMERTKHDKIYQEQMVDYQAWLTGLYVQYAIGACFNKNTKYPSVPFSQKYGETNAKGGISKKKTKNEIVAERIKNNLKRGKAILDRGRR